jgi:hypothetical protein
MVVIDNVLDKRSPHKAHLVCRFVTVFDLRTTPELTY